MQEVSVNVKPAMLEWAMQKARTAENTFAIETIGKWISGEKRPTFSQIEKVSKEISVPFGYFFLQEPPAERSISMILDYEIKEMAETLIGNYQESNVQSIGYDLETESFNKKPLEALTKITLAPYESVFVTSKESITLPHDMAAKVYLRNSRIRQGLALDAPLYQPGHCTKVFFRITNMSNDTIRLQEGDQIAFITFERLRGNVQHSYEGAFQDEADFRGMGNYAQKYAEDVVDVDKKVDSIKNIEKDIYGNVLSIMAIFVGIFSLININAVSALNNIAPRAIMSLNLTTAGSVGFMVGLVNTVIPGGKEKYRITAWAMSIIAYTAAAIISQLK